MGPPWKRGIQHALAEERSSFLSLFFPFFPWHPHLHLCWHWRNSPVIPLQAVSLRASCVCWGEERCWRGAAHTAPSLQQNPSVHLQHKSPAGRAGNGGISVPPTLCLPSESLTVLHLIMKGIYAKNKILVQSGEYTLGVFIRKGIWNKAGLENSYYFR